MECVIGLAPNLFYNSPMEACILICRMNKQPNRRGKVLFINAVNDVERKNAQSCLTDSHIQRIAAAYDAYQNDAGFAQVADTREIAENHFSLSIPLYVKPPADDSGTDTRTLQQHYESWRTSAQRAMRSYALLNGMIEKGGGDIG